jgi:molybdate transport system ATP-binding protein
MTLEVDIKKTFGSYSLDVSFTAEDEVFGLLGASGCGKSLTMRSIAGIETPDEGRIVVNGQVFFDSDAGINLKPQQRKTALLFQNYMLFPNLTVEQNVAAGIPKDTPKDEVEKLVLAHSETARQLNGAQPKRIIVVPGRIVNVVL